MPNPSVPLAMGVTGQHEKVLSLLSNEPSESGPQTRIGELSSGFALPLRADMQTSGYKVRLVPLADTRAASLVQNSCVRCKALTFGRASAPYLLVLKN